MKLFKVLCQNTASKQTTHNYTTGTPSNIITRWYWVLLGTSAKTKAGCILNVTYLEWNDLLAKYCFSEEKAGKEVLLYVNEPLINKLGAPLGGRGA